MEHKGENRSSCMVLVGKPEDTLEHSVKKSDEMESGLV